MSAPVGGPTVCLRRQFDPAAGGPGHAPTGRRTTATVIASLLLQWRRISQLRKEIHGQRPCDHATASVQQSPPQNAGMLVTAILGLTVGDFDQLGKHANSSPAACRNCARAFEPAVESGDEPISAHAITLNGVSPGRDCAAVVLVRVGAQVCAAHQLRHFRTHSLHRKDTHAAAMQASWCRPQGPHEVSLTVSGDPTSLRAACWTLYSSARLWRRDGEFHCSARWSRAGHVMLVQSGMELAPHTHRQRITRRRAAGQRRRSLHAGSCHREDR